MLRGSAARWHWSLLIFSRSSVSLLLTWPHVSRRQGWDEGLSDKHMLTGASPRLCRLPQSLARKGFSGPHRQASAAYTGTDTCTSPTPPWGPSVALWPLVNVGFWDSLPRGLLWGPGQLRPPCDNQSHPCPDPCAFRTPVKFRMEMGVQGFTCRGEYSQYPQGRVILS